VKLQISVEDDSGSENKPASGMSASVAGSDSVCGCTDAPRGVGIANGRDSSKE
jgi:hypothetical protein